MRITVEGDEMIFDFRESDSQASGPCNMTLGVTLSAAYNAVLHLTDSGYSTQRRLLPADQGAHQARARS